MAQGVVLYRMLTGRLPCPPTQFLPFAEQVARGWFRSPSRVNPAVPPQLDRLVGWLMDVNPLKRPPAEAALRRHGELIAQWATIGAHSAGNIPGPEAVQTSPENPEPIRGSGPAIAPEDPVNPRAHPLFDSVVNGPAAWSRPGDGQGRPSPVGLASGAGRSEVRDQESAQAESETSVANAVVFIVLLFLGIMFWKWRDPSSPATATKPPAKNPVLTAVSPPLPRPSEPRVVELPARLDQSSDKFEGQSAWWGTSRPPKPRRSNWWPRPDPDTPGQRGARSGS